MTFSSASVYDGSLLGLSCRRIDKAAERHCFASFVTELLPSLSTGSALGSQLLYLEDTMPAYFARDALLESCRVLGHEAYVAAVVATVPPGSGAPSVEVVPMSLQIPFGAPCPCKF